MSHLRHKIPWSELSKCCRTPDSSAIYLPVGECGSIHINTKSTEMQISNRKYIDDSNVCKKDCAIEKHQRFEKKPPKSPELSARRSKHWNDENKKQIDYFSKKFFETIVEFAKTEENRKTYDVISDEAFSDLVANMCKKGYWGENEGRVLALFLNQNVQQLVSMHSEQKLNVSTVLNQNYGGQAVGNGFRFLIWYHLVPFYLTANMILYLNLQNEPDKWGRLNPKSYFFRDLFHDCDFLTFIPSLRPLLKEEVFMKDIEKTHELLKKVFEYIYYYFFMSKKVGYIKNYEEFYDDITSEVYYTFGFNYWN